ncbi:MAG: hypothetical protein OXG39_12980 [Chloroflexi bacterium]|nr:hypothetical protein [Chloroflexota bacterium]
MDWGQTIATIASVLAVGVGLLAYITRQFNRISDQLVNLDNRVKSVENEQTRFNERFNRVDDRFNRVDDRFDRMEARIDRLEERLEEGLQDVRGDLQSLGIEQARMLGFLEGRGVMTKATVDAESAS